MSLFLSLTSSLIGYKSPLVFAVCKVQLNLTPTNNALIRTVIISEFFFNITPLEK